MGIDAPIIDRTIDTHIKNLRKNCDLTVLLLLRELDINMRRANQKVKTISKNFSIYPHPNADDYIISKRNDLSCRSYYGK